MSQQAVPIDQVKIGMFIEDMDIPWMDSPFLRHKKKIKSAKDIALLKKAGVKVLTINVEKSDVLYQQTDDGKPTAKNTREEKTPNQKNVVEKSSQPDAQSQFKDQYNAAKKLQNQVSKVLDAIAEDIASGGPINSNSLTPIVQESLSLIDQHNQALLALLHGQRRNKQIQAHSFSVMSLAIGFSDQLKLPEAFKVTLATSALLHETGWTRLPLNLFLKGKSYTENERKLTLQHIPIIAGILKNSPGIDTLIIKTVVQHHAQFPPEPDFTVATDPGIAQILALCNLYDALIHGIGEHTAQLPANAVRKLLALAKQQQFQMELVTAFIKYVGVYPIGSAVKLSDGSKAVVFDINRASPMQPKVRRWYDQTGKALTKGEDIALSESDLKIAEVINAQTGNNDPYDLLSLAAE